MSFWEPTAISSILLLLVPRLGLEKVAHTPQAVVTVGPAEKIAGVRGVLVGVGVEVGVFVGVRVFVGVVVRVGVGVRVAQEAGP